MKVNAIRLYKHFCEMVENPKGVDNKEREICRRHAVNSKADMENKFRTSKVYKDDPEILELLGVKPEVKEEKKKDGKKSKR